MPLSFAFRQSIKHSSLRVRRLQVLMFCFWIAALLVTAGHPLPARSLVALRILPIVSLFSILTFDRNPRRRSIMVTSLDDRATLRYGAEFDQLTPDQQHDILSRYQVGTYLFPFTPNPDQRRHEEASTLQAHRLLRRALVPLLAVYWAGWQWIPAGYLRACWTNAPIVLGTLIAVVLGLPHLLHLWTWRDQPALTPQPARSSLTRS